MMSPDLNNMLPFSTFEKITKNEIYHLYCEVYQANVQKDQIIQHYLEAINEKTERRGTEPNNSPNERFKEFKELLSHFSETSDLITNLKVLPIAQSLRNITDYSSLYYDVIHLIFSSGLPFLKNLVLSTLLITSNPC